MASSRPGGDRLADDPRDVLGCEELGAGDRARRRRWSSCCPLAGWDVRVHAEEVGRIEAVLERRQAAEALAVGGPGGGGVLVGEEVRVDAGAERAQRLP